MSLSISVGPPIKSPNVPICSTSPTNVASPIPPPSAPPINLFVLPLNLILKHYQLIFLLDL